jgi:2-hydroxy-6-oxonona-2,4-dienedioate hydrolase
MRPFAASRRNRIALAVGAVLAMVSLGLYLIYARDMQRIRQHVAAGSELAQSRHGPIEYAVSGSGPAVLVVHGAGGGYDQGQLLPQAFGGDGFTWISVSRFGYLRSAMPQDASTRAQAEAFADLLDGLGIRRVAILAMSGGVPPALQFAERYPDRTTALVLLSSAPFTPLTARQQELPMPAWMYQLLFSTDFVFWLITRLSPASLDPIFDISPAARAGMTAADRAFAAGLIAAFLPVTARTAGLRNEGAAVDPAARHDLARITAPALVVHARDDGINPFAFGEYTARHIPGAAFLVLDDGGHILLGHLEEVREAVTAFLRQHAGPAG